MQFNIRVCYFCIPLIIFLSPAIRGQSLSKEEIKKHKIKKFFIDGPNSKYYEIEEYDTSGNLLTVSEVNNGGPPFVTEELKYSSSLLMEKREYKSYDSVSEITRYFYNTNKLLVQEQDTSIYPNHGMLNNGTEYKYNDRNQLILREYHSGSYHISQKYFYNAEGLLVKTEALQKNRKAFVNFYFYNKRKEMTCDSVYNFDSKSGIKTAYRYDTDGRLLEQKSMNGKIMISQILFFYDGNGLLNKRRMKQMLGKKYYTSETYYNYEY